MIELNNVLEIENVPNMIEISDDESNELYKSIIDVEMAKELFEMAKNDGDLNTLKFTMQLYLESIKTHKILWRKLLVKYVDIKFASYYYDIYKYDVIRKVIFLNKNKEKECIKCK